MGTSTLIQKESKLHNSKAKSVNHHIVNATHITDYTLLITFEDGKVNEVDFAPALAKYAKGYYAKYLQPKHFKAFKIEDNNIVWGKDWDLIFEPQLLYKNKLHTIT